MKAFICDRCGKTITIDDLTRIKKDYPTAYNVIDFDLVDVCPSCCSKFEDWWRPDNASTK